MILRSMLYVPGNKSNLFDKAVNSAADGIIFDIEDSVPISEKESARESIREFTDKLGQHKKEVFVRVNSMKSGIVENDVHGIVNKKVSGIILAKTESEKEISDLAELIENEEKKYGISTKQIKIIALIESALGVINCHKIGKSKERVIGIAFGAGDYMSDLGLDITNISNNQEELLFAKSSIVNICKAFGLEAIDSPYLLSLKDVKKFEKEVNIAKKLGFSGKQCIHPNQIEFVNQSFSPTKKSIEHSKRLIKAFEEAENLGMGAVSFEGKMIDIMSYKQAKKVLEKEKSLMEKIKK